MKELAFLFSFVSGLGSSMSAPPSEKAMESLRPSKVVGQCFTQCTRDPFPPYTQRCSTQCF